MDNHDKSFNSFREYYYCFLNDTTLEKLKEAEEKDVISVIQEEMATDTENDSAKLIDLYQKVSKEERALLDYMLVCLCGYTMSSIIEKAKW